MGRFLGYCLRFAYIVFSLLWSLRSRLLPLSSEFCVAVAVLVVVVAAVVVCSSNYIELPVELLAAYPVLANNWLSTHTHTDKSCQSDSTLSCLFVRVVATRRLTVQSPSLSLTNSLSLSVSAVRCRMCVQLERQRVASGF